MEKLPGNHIDEIINPRADQEKLIGTKSSEKVTGHENFDGFHIT